MIKKIEDENSFYEYVIYLITSGSGRISFSEKKLKSINLDKTIETNTLLGFAVIYRNLYSDKFFSENGADINALNIKNLTPLDLAVKSGNYEIVNFLFKNKAESGSDEQRFNLFVYFLENGYWENAKSLSIENFWKRLDDLENSGKLPERLNNLSVYKTIIDGIVLGS